MRWHPTPVLLPGKSPGWRSLVGCSPWGRKESDTTERLHFHFYFSLSCIGEGNGNPLQCSCLENPRDGGAWWAAVYRVAQSQTRLKRLSSSSSSFTTTTTIKAILFLEHLGMGMREVLRGHLSLGAKPVSGPPLTTGPLSWAHSRPHSPATCALGGVQVVSSGKGDTAAAVCIPLGQAWKQEESLLHSSWTLGAVTSLGPPEGCWKSACEVCRLPSLYVGKAS